MNVPASPEQPVILPGGEGRIQLPTYADGWLIDPRLSDASGDNHRPDCLGVWGDVLTYRWLIEDTMVTLSTRRYEVQERHAHRSQFAAIDRGSSRGEAVIETADWTRPSRPPVWRQERTGIAAAITRTHELHRNLTRLLVAEDV